MIDISIPSTTNVGNYIAYNIEVRLYISTKRNYVFKTTKRFSDFFPLRDKLGVSFALPSRLSSYYRANDDLLEERKLKLEEFTRFLFNDANLKTNEHVLQFYNVSKSAILEDDMITSTDNSDEKPKLKTQNDVDSPQKWMSQFKLIESSIQDARNKIFSNYNILEIRNILRSVDINIKTLQKYLNTTNELNSTEIDRRKDLLIKLKREFQEIQTLSSDVSYSSSVQSLPQSSAMSASTSSKGRMLGKPKETDTTKLLNNTGLLKLQKQTIQSQDEQLDQLREMIIRQKQMGVAINEELDLQNELLSDLNDQVDQSERKLGLAKHKLNKIS